MERPVTFGSDSHSGIRNLRGLRVISPCSYLHSFSSCGHKLANLGLIRVLFAAILALGIVIVRKRSAHIVAEFNSDLRTAVRAVQGSFFFDHQSPASFSLASILIMPADMALDRLGEPWHSDAEYVDLETLAEG